MGIDPALQCFYFWRCLGETEKQPAANGGRNGAKIGSFGGSKPLYVPLTRLNSIIQRRRATVQGLSDNIEFTE